MNESPTKALRAETNPKFYARFRWLGPILVAFSLYCVYDGYYTWPNQRERALALEEIARTELSDADLHDLKPDAHGVKELYPEMVKHVKKSDDLLAQWKAVAAENGWPEEPAKKYRTEGDIYGQYLMAVLVAIAAAWMLTALFLSFGRWITIDEAGVVSSSWGQSFPASLVTGIDKRQWRDKGIARVAYVDEGGRKRRFIVDNYKYRREATDRILFRIEQIAGLDKVTGGKPETDPDMVDAAPTAATESVASDPEQSTA